MKPQSCKSKGRKLQQRVAASILDAFPHLVEDDVFSTSMGAPGEDVRMSPLARSALPLSIECKCVERLNVWAALEQARANTPGKNIETCLIFSKNRSPTYAVVPWPALLELYRMRHGKKSIDESSEAPTTSPSSNDVPSDGLASPPPSDRAMELLKELERELLKRIP